MNDHRSDKEDGPATLWPVPLLRLAIAVTLAMPLLAGLSGCGQSEVSAAKKSPNSETEEKKKDELPEVPGQQEDLFGGDLIKDPGAAERRVNAAAESYVQDSELKSGALKGVCVFAGKPPSLKALAKLVTKPTPIESRIKGAETGEVDFYKNALSSKTRKLPGWIYTIRNTPYPTGAVITLKNVRGGPKAPLARPLFNVSFGQVKRSVMFCPQHERLVFATWDPYACHVQLLRYGQSKPLFEGDIHYYKKSDTKVDVSYDNSAGRRLPRPKTVQCDPISEKGIYEVRCTRHAWHRARLHVVDNPYVAIAKGSHRIGSAFSMNGIPVGRHTLEVWHPVLKPVQDTIEVEIKKDETAMLKIAFEPPTSNGK